MGVCRFCLETDQEENLVCPCKCDGTSKWVHRECLENSRNHEANMNKCMSCLHAYEFEDNPWVVICSLFTCKDEKLHDVMISIVSYNIAGWFEHSLFVERLHPSLIYPLWGVLFDYHEAIKFVLYYSFSKWMVVSVYWFFLCFTIQKRSRSVYDILRETHGPHDAAGLLVLGIVPFFFFVLFSLTQNLVDDGMDVLVSRQYIKNFKRKY